MRLNERAPPRQYRNAQSCSTKFSTRDVALLLLLPPAGRHRLGALAAGRHALAERELSLRAGREVQPRPVPVALRAVGTSPEQRPPGVVMRHRRRLRRLVPA